MGVGAGRGSDTYSARGLRGLREDGVMALQQDSSPKPGRGVTLILDADGSVTLYGSEKWNELREDPIFLVVRRPHPGIERDNSDAGGEERHT